MSEGAVRVVVVGGTSGIGEATAKLFLDQGAEVWVCGRNQDRLRGSLDRLKGAQGEQLDGADRAACEQFFRQLGPFDHLVLALSGGSGAGPIRELSLGKLREAFEAKVFAQLNVLQQALPSVRNSITLVSAGSARAALPGTVGLAAVNGALEAAVRPLAAELAPIRVNAVSPGVIATPWWEGMPREAKESFFRDAAASLPVRRVGQPDDVARAILMLALNPFITGTTLEVDGGMHLARSM